MQGNQRYYPITLFNPTGWNAHVKAMGYEYSIPAFSETVIHDLWHVEHIIKSFKHIGVVPVEYGEKMQKQFATYEEYKQAQEIKGLKEVLKFKEQCLRNEKQAEKDIVTSGKGNEGYKAALNKERFERDIQLIKQWIVEAGGTLDRKAEVEEVVEKRPDWKNEESNVQSVTLRRGRPRKNDEPRADADQDAATS